jgi:hypothetical protein
MMLVVNAEIAEQCCLPELHITRVLRSKCFPAARLPPAFVGKRDKVRRGTL